MEKYKKAALISFIVYLALIVLTCYKEAALFEVTQPIFVSKIVLFILGLGLLVWIKKSPWSYYANLCVGLHFVAFCCLGQLQSPFYFLYFQILMVAYSFLFPVDRKVFKLIIVFGSMLFCLTFLKTYDQTILELQKPEAKNLFVISIFASVILSYLSHAFFTADRTIKNDLLNRFSIVGLQAAQVVHDIKNSLFPSLITVEVLKNTVKNSNDQKLVDLSLQLEQQIKSFKSVIEPLNRISTQQTGIISDIDFTKAIVDLKLAMGSQLTNVDLNISGEGFFRAEAAAIKSVFYNLMQNSLEQFRRMRTVNPKISWHYSHAEIIYQDNGGGFSEEILKSIKQDQFNQGHGSSLGLFVVSQTISRLGGSVLFANAEEGVKITIKLKS